MVEMTINHIPSRYFTNGIDYMQRYEIKRDYGDECWDKAKRYLSHKSKISASAVRITEVMEENLGLKLFPLVIKIACKGWDISGGTYAFMMIDEDGNEYYFDARARYYKTMSGQYDISMIDRECVIFRNK